MQILKLLPRFVFLLLLTATVVFAQDDPSPTPTPTATPQDGAAQSQQPTPSPTPSASPVVTAKIIPRVVAMLGHLELDDILEVKVQNLEQWTQANENNDHRSSKHEPAFGGVHRGS